MVRHTKFTKDLLDDFSKHFRRRKIVKEFPKVFCQDSLEELLVYMGSSWMVSRVSRRTMV